MRTLFVSLLFLSACGKPEAITAQKFLGCLAKGDVQCLRRYHAPLVPRLTAWVRARKVDPLFVGKFARRAMRDADNPFWALMPLACAQRAQAKHLAPTLVSALRGCTCKKVGSQKVPPASARRSAFIKEKAKAIRLHPAMEILAIRSTAEALRVSQLVDVSCTCGALQVDLAMLDLVGRSPRWRVYKASGVCGKPDAAGLKAHVRKTEQHLLGKL